MESILVQIECESADEAESIKARIPMILSFTKGFLSGSKYKVLEDKIISMIKGNVLSVSIDLKAKEG